jgi:hypothetical protein
MDITQLNSYNCGHLVLSPHPNDRNSFRKHIPDIVKWIQNKRSINFFSIVEEYGDNDHLHLDIILFSNSDINKNILNNKGKQIGLSGMTCSYRDKHMPSTKEVYYKYLNKKTEHEKKYFLAYNIKEQETQEDFKRYSNIELTEETKKELLQYYKDNKTSKNKKDNYMDIIPLNSKNFTQIMINNLSSKYKLPDQKEGLEEYISTELITDSMKQGYCWLQMSKNNVKKAIHQLKIMFNIEDGYDIEEINKEMTNIENEDEMELYKYKKIRHMKADNRYKRLLEFGMITEAELTILKHANQS